MLEDIAHIALSIGSGDGLPVDAGLDLDQGRETQSRIERIHLLEALWPEVAAVLQAIHRQPDARLVLCDRTSCLPLSQGNAALASRIARTPHLAGAWRHLTSSQTASYGSSESALEEPRYAPSTSTRANRFVARLLDTLIKEATSLATVSDFCGEEEYARSMRALARLARSQRRSDLLGDLPSLTWEECARLPTEDATVRFAPAYRTLFQIWRRLHSTLSFDWSTLPWVSFSARPTWQIYEIWCFLQIVAGLRSVGWQQADKEGVRIIENRLCLTLAKGRQSRLQFVRRPPPPHSPHRHHGLESVPVFPTTVDLYYQPLYPSANQHHAMDPGNDPPGRNSLARVTPCFVSTSHAMQPDIALCLGSKLFLLDPKFRSYAEPGEEQDDIDKMHAYRDAIQLRTAGVAEGRPVVVAAVCLFPGQSRRAADLSETPDAALLPLEQALRSYPAPTVGHPFGMAPVGAVRLRPGERNAGIRVHDLLSHWLDNAKK